MEGLTDYHKKKITEIIADLSGFQEELVSEETQLADGLGLDSLDVVEIIVKIDEEFGCNIPDEDYAHVKTVNDIFKVVSNQNI